MGKLGELFGNFLRIDLDTPGGYANVVDVITGIEDSKFVHRALKVMRHDIDYQKGMERFKDELEILSKLTRDIKSPLAIPRIYDSGFIPLRFSQLIASQEAPDPNIEIIQTGLDLANFLQEESSLNNKGRDIRWLPYLLVELAPFDDNLFRQLKNQPLYDPFGRFRLPTGEVLLMAIQLLEMLDYLHTVYHRAYLDWKPEHVFWNGYSQTVKLIDWNVTLPLSDGPGRQQNIRDDIHLFCGAVLYVGLTFADPEDYSSRSINARPTTDFVSPIMQVRHRYWTDKPDFSARDLSLSEDIKKIIRRGLDPEQGFDNAQELISVLLEYANSELGLSRDEIVLGLESQDPYLKALVEIRSAQNDLLLAQQHLIKAISQKGKTLEFTRLFDVVKHALENFPAS